MSTKCELRAKIAALKRQLREAEEQLRDLEMCEINEIKTLPWGGTMISRSPGKVCASKITGATYIRGVGYAVEVTERCRRTDPLEDLINALNFR